MVINLCNFPIIIFIVVRLAIFSAFNRCSANSLATLCSCGCAGGIVLCISGILMEVITKMSKKCEFANEMECVRTKLLTKQCLHGKCSYVCGYVVSIQLWLIKNHLSN